MIILQNPQTGEIKNIKTGFDWTTFILSFFALGWIPSLFRKDFIGTIFLFIIQMLPFVFIITYLFDKNEIISIVLLATILLYMYYTIYRCIINLKRYSKKLKIKGFKPVILK